MISRRSTNARDEHGTWDPGGGGLKFGERIEDAVRREVLEEYCATALAIEFVGYRDVFRSMNGQQTHWLMFDHKVLVDPAEVKIGEPHKCDGLRWVTLEEVVAIDEPMHSQFPAFLGKNLERFK